MRVWREEGIGISGHETMGARDGVEWFEAPGDVDVHESAAGPSPVLDLRSGGGKGDRCRGYKAGFCGS